MTLNLFGSGVTVSEPPEPGDERVMLCGTCHTYMPHTKQENGDWICVHGHNANEQAAEEANTLAMIEAAARLFRQMPDAERERWLAVFVDCLGADVAGQMLDAIGRSKL